MGFQPMKVSSILTFRSIINTHMNNFREDNPEFYINNNKDNLVITIGDSWTFGDSLGNISHTGVDDLQARQTQAYGKHLSDELNADWINCGYCGWGNIKIIQTLYELVTGSYAGVINKKIFNDIKDHNWGDFNLTTHTKYKEEIHQLLKPKPLKYNLSHYKNVYYFVTLTETGRLFEYIDIDNSKPMLDLLIYQENILYQYIETLIKTTDINIVIARNFSKDYTDHSNLVLPLNWVQLNYNYNRTGNNNLSLTYDDISCTGPVTNIAFNSIRICTKRGKFVDYFDTQYNYTKNLRKWLLDNPLHHNIASCHPTKKSHKLWADYLLQHMDKKIHVG
jgi:hypothetical protein